MVADYDTVNKEIEDFLAAKISDDKVLSDKTDLKYVLESLLHVYNEINNSLRSNNAEGVKDAILRNDIRVSMVNEELLKSFKRLTEDRDHLLEENYRLDRDKRECSEKLTRLKLDMENTETGKEKVRRNIEEMNRMLGEQKNKIKNLIETVEALKREKANQEKKVEELERLRLRLAERFSCIERETAGLTKQIEEREETIKKLKDEYKNEASQNLNVKTKLAEIERKNEVLRQNFDVKEKNLALCTEEMSKVLVLNRRFSYENEKYKTSSSYYERLYKNINEQNIFLTRQINKMIRSEEFSKDGLKFVEEADEKEKKLRSEIDGLRKEKERLIDQNEDLKEKFEESLYKVNTADDTVILNEKIEKLKTINKEYKKKVEELEKKNSAVDEKKEEKIFKQENQQRNFAPSISNDFFDKYRRQTNFNNLPLSDTNIFKPSQNLAERLNFKLSSPHIQRDVLNDYKTPVFNPNLFREIKTPKTYFSDNNTNEPRINLSRNYEKLPEVASSALPGGLENQSSDTFKMAGPVPLSMSGDDDDKGSKVDRELLQRMIDLSTRDSPVQPPPGKTNKKQKYRKTQPRKNKSPLQPTNHELSLSNPFDVASDSVRSYQTSSSLKDMMERTDRLKKKFESLDNALGTIKESKMPAEDKLKEQIKTYNSYYSDINIEDNDSDIL